MKENIGAAIRGTRTYAISNLAESGPTTADGHAEAIEKEEGHRVAVIPLLTFGLNAANSSQCYSRHAHATRPAQALRALLRVPRVREMREMRAASRFRVRAGFRALGHARG